MKIKVNKANLLDCLLKVQSVISSRNALPVLSNIHFKAQDGRLELTATDLTITIRASLDAEVLEPGATTLPAKRIVGVFGDLSVDTVVMDVNAHNIASIKAGASSFKIHGISESDFPNLPEMEDPKIYRIEQGAFRQMLKLTSYAASMDASRQLLNGVLLSFEGGKLSVVATDSRRLALVDTEVEFPADSEIRLILPLKTVDELKRVLTDTGEIKISATLKQVSFEFDSLLGTPKTATEGAKGAPEASPATARVLMFSKLTDGNYPNFRQVVPPLQGERVTMERETLLTAVRRTSRLVSDAVAGVKLNFTQNSVEIVAAAADIGEARETMAVKYTGPDLGISFNPIFLMDTLKELPTDEVYLDLVDETSPGVMRAPISFVYVLMPIRIS